jgi:O-antigen ligase/Tfp pilus assembly protein PilF
VRNAQGEAAHEVTRDRSRQSPKSIRVYGPLFILGGLSVFTPLIEGGTTHPSVLIVRLVVLATFTGWLFLSMRAGWITVYRTPLFPAIAVFIGWAAFSVLRSPYTAISLAWLISILGYAALLVLVLQLVNSTKQVRWLVAIMLGMGLFEAVVGISQYLWLGQSRARGTFFNANFLAAYEVAVFALAFGLLCYLPRGTQRRWETSVLGITASIVGLGFVLAQSRGALLALVVAVGFVGCYRFGKVFLGVLVLSLVVGALVPNPLQQRVLTIGPQDPYAFTRLDIWKNSLQRIEDHPWGMGLGVYKYASFHYRFPIEDAIARYWKRAESAHNEYLQMAVELGLVGVAIFLVGAGLLGREIWDTLNGELESWERGVVAGLTGGILGILAHAGVDSVLHEPALVQVLILSAGLIMVVKRLRGRGAASVWVVPFPYHPVRAALVGCLATLLGLLIIRPAAAWCAFEQGNREITASRTDRALAWYQRATEIDPGISAYHDAVAFTEVQLYQRSGDVWWLHRAVGELKVALELNPLDARLANRVGTLYGLLSERATPGPERAAILAQAAASYEQAIRLDPYTPFNYLELGKIRWAQGHTEEAQALFKQATSYEPNFLPARVHLAELHLQFGRKEAADLEYAEIARIQARYQGRTLTTLERKYLEVDLKQFSGR